MSQKKSKVTGKQKKLIETAVKKARPFGKGKVPVTAQQSIPFICMYPDGICKVTDTFFTKTVQFFDINYQLAQNEDKILSVFYYPILLLSQSDTHAFCSPYHN